MCPSPQSTCCSQPTRTARSSHGRVRSACLLTGVWSIYSFSRSWSCLLYFFSPFCYIVLIFLFVCFSVCLFFYLFVFVLFFWSFSFFVNSSVEIYLRMYFWLVSSSFFSVVTWALLITSHRRFCSIRLPMARRSIGGALAAFCMSWAHTRKHEPMFKWIQWPPHAHKRMLSQYHTHTRV